jgi:hypothetical protein
MCSAALYSSESINPWRGRKNSRRIGGTLIFESLLYVFSVSGFTRSPLLWASKSRNHIAHVSSVAVMSLSSPFNSCTVFMPLVFMSILENFVKMTLLNVCKRHELQEISTSKLADIKFKELKQWEEKGQVYGRASVNIYE